MKIIDESFSIELANALLDINAVVLRPNEPFVWSSGWNSPIYCDNRLTLRHPELRAKITGHLADHIRKTFPDIDVITGTATAGIPHAAWVADRLEKPMAYVRSKVKSYGMGNQIEGGVKKGESTLVIEDLISTGSSILSVVDVLKFIGAEVRQLLTIFTYGFDVAEKRIADYHLPAFCLTDFNTLIGVAQERGIIDNEELELLAQWRSNPDVWPNYA